MEMGTLVVKSKRPQDLWGAEIQLDGKRYTVDGPAKTEIEGPYIKQWWILIKEGQA